MHRAILLSQNSPNFEIPKNTGRYLVYKTFCPRYAHRALNHPNDKMLPIKLVF